MFCLGRSPHAHASADVGPRDVDGDDVNAVHRLLRAPPGTDVVELRDPALDVRFGRAAGARYADLDASGSAVASLIAFGLGDGCQVAGIFEAIAGASSEAEGTDP
jgi:hypothetical protein